MPYSTQSLQKSSAEDGIQLLELFGTDFSVHGFQKGMLFQQGEIQIYNLHLKARKVHFLDFESNNLMCLVDKAGKIRMIETVFRGDFENEEYLELNEQYGQPIHLLKEGHVTENPLNEQDSTALSQVVRDTTVRMIRCTFEEGPTLAAWQADGFKIIIDFFREYGQFVVRIEG